jgi:hypothetical protein
MADPLREHVRDLLSWSDAHLDFDAAAAAIPPGKRGTAPRGLPYSPWQLLEHLRITQRDILDFCGNDYQPLNWPDDYWPATAEPPGEDAWDASVAAYRADREALLEIAADPRIDLYAAISHGEGQTWLRELLLAADHASYHVGEMVVLRRLLEE